MEYAYIRVSTKEQHIDRQVLALQAFHIPPQNIYCDHQSGKNFDRPAYKKLLKCLKPGDLLIIKSIDRLGRNYNDILIQWQYITKKLKADIVVLDMELLDTREKSGTLAGTLIADFSLCSPDREGIYPPKTGGRNCCSKSKGKKIGKNTSYNA